MFAATVLALTSAALHAGWNLFIKTSEARDLASWGQFLFGGLLTIPVLLVIGLPPREVWWLLVLSACVHAVYINALVRAYHHGDFSLAYPIARGGGAFLAAIGGVLFLGDVLPAPAWFAIFIIVVGLISLMGRGATWLSIIWALGTAVTIATYTLIDAHGAREAGPVALDGVRYGFALMPLSAITVSVVALARGRATGLQGHDGERLVAISRGRNLFDCRVHPCARGRAAGPGGIRHDAARVVDHPRRLGRLAALEGAPRPPSSDLVGGHGHRHGVAHRVRMMFNR